ncbi:HD domain-containing protein [candidate division KSB1 bacterium]
MVFKRKLTKEEVEVIEEIIVFVENKHHRAEGHDYSHILEVCKHSIEIARRIKDKVDPFILICGALLHDIGRINAPSGLFHGIDGGARAMEFLQSLIEDEHTILKITRIIVRHTPTSMIAPETPEEKVVYDADALDRLGYIGMARGLMGKTGTIHSILENRIKKRMADYHKLNYKESRKLGKTLHKHTIKIVKELKAGLKTRYKDIREIESYKLILEEEAKKK